MLLSFSGFICVLNRTASQTRPQFEEPQLQKPQNLFRITVYASRDTYTMLKRELQTLKRYIKNQKTPWSWDLLERPRIVQLHKKFPECSLQKVHYMFTRALHLPLSWGRAVQSIPPPPYLLRSILILFTHLCLGLPSSLFPICFTLLAHSYYIPYPSHPSWRDNSNHAWRRIKVLKLLIMRLSQTSSYLISPRYK
jgi:hypothetical protein